MNYLSEIKISDFTYQLPDDRIAKFPLAERANSKLLVYKNGEMLDRFFHQAAEELHPNTTLVFNNTKVVQARLLFQKTIDARPIEIFCLEPHNQDVQSAMAAQQKIVYQCLVGNAKRWREGQLLTLNITINGEIIVLKAEKLERLGTSFLVAFVWNSPHTFSQILEAAGKMPLPPYLNRDSTEKDKQTYQTIYAQHDGSVAAPTAGLHFTESLLKTFAKKGIKLLETTLHVGAGTFKPVQTTHVQDHTMHHEEIHITAQLISELIHVKGDVIAVGTTSTRTLESLYWLGVKHIKLGDLFEDELYLNQWEAYELPQNIEKKEALQSLLNYMANKGIAQLYSHTQLMILPGYRFRVIDGLFTNFHQPASTLILLVATAVGNNWRNIYNHALANNYRFLSYGDGSLLFVEKENNH